jgi:hypothetical protein
MRRLLLSGSEDWAVQVPANSDIAAPKVASEKRAEPSWYGFMGVDFDGKVKLQSKEKTDLARPLLGIDSGQGRHSPRRPSVGAAALMQGPTLNAQDRAAITWAGIA